MTETSRRFQWLAAACLAAAVPAQAQGLSPVHFTPDSGLQIRLLLHGAGGDRLIDDSGHGRDVTLPPRGGPVRVPGGLSWSPGVTAPLTLPDMVQRIQNVEIAFAGSVTAPGRSPPFEMLAGYAGADPAIALRLNNTYAGDGGLNAGVEGWDNTWLGTQQVAATGTLLANVGSLANGVVDNALHVVGLAIDRSSGATTLYLDGLPVAPYRTGPAGTTDAPQRATNGVWQVGGASPGTRPCPVTACGYGGRIYGVSMSTTFPTAERERADALAWHDDVERVRGVRELPFYGRRDAPVLLVAFGESWTWDHGGADPASDNYPVRAAGDLGAALGRPVTAQVDGEDGIGGYVMSQACSRKLHAQAWPGENGGIRIALLMGRGNSLAAHDGALPVAGRWPDNAGGAAAAAADVAGLGDCARREERADGYGVVLFGVSTAAVSVGNDRAYKDVANPVYRRLVPRSGMVLADFADDPRIGADGAGRGGDPDAPVRDCVPDGGGPPVPTYGPDLNHLTACGEQLVGHMTAAAAMWALNARDAARAGPRPPVAVTAMSAVQALAEAGRAMTLRGGARLALLNHDGLAPGTVVATVTDTGAEPDTITGGTAPNGGARDLIDGAPAYALAPGRTVSFVVTFNGDAAGTGGVAARPEPAGQGPPGGSIVPRLDWHPFGR